MLFGPSGKGRKRQKKGEKGRFRPISRTGGQTPLKPPFVTPPFAATQLRPDLIWTRFRTDFAVQWGSGPKGGCGGLGGENRGALPKAGLIFQQPLSLLEGVQTLAGIASRAAQKQSFEVAESKEFRAATAFSSFLSHTLSAILSCKGNARYDGVSRSGPHAQS